MEDFLISWVTAHTGRSFVAYLAFMVAVQALPRPTENNGTLYIWLYQFLHALSMNLKLAYTPLKGLPPSNQETVEKAPEPPPVSHAEQATGKSAGV